MLGYRQLEYDHAKFPKGDSDKGRKLASLLYEWFEYNNMARSELTNVVWRSCNDAYNMFRVLPRNKAMNWVDKSTQGESDIRDSVDLMVDMLMMALMGRNGSWMTPISYKSEDQAVQNTIRDYLVYKHNCSATRDKLNSHYNQLFRLGTSAYSLEWQRIYRMKRMDPAQSTLLIDQAAQFMVDVLGIDPSDSIGEVEKQVKRQRAMELTYSGPLVQNLDMYDVVLDATSDLRSTDDLPICTITYKTLDELKNAKDIQGKALYENLDGLEEWTPAQIQSLVPGRNRNLQALGINPLFTDYGYGSTFVPVLVFNRFVQKLDDDTWVDSYFHVALKASRTPQLIRCHENPSDYGHRDVFIDQYSDICNAAYGTGMVEKSLSNWHKKNIVSALGLNAMMVEVFPPMVVISDLLIDDRELDAAPGSHNNIEYKPQIGTNFAAPLPIASGGAERAMVYERALAQKILSQTGATGALMNDPSMTNQQSKTATQMNIEQSSGSISQQNRLEKVSRNLEPFAQAYYDSCRQYEEDEIVNFISNVEGGDPQMVELARDVLNQDRRIVVTGYHGLQNRAAEIQNLKDMIQIMTTGNAAQILQNAPEMLQDLLMQLMGDLGLKNVGKYQQSAFSLAQKDPNFQQTVIQLLQRLEGGGVPLPVCQTIAQTLLPPQQPQQGKGAGAPGMPPQGGSPVPGAQGGPGGPQPQGLAVQGGQDVG